MRPRSPTPPTGPLEQLQRQQRGVFSLKQARALGWTRAQVDTAVRRGEWLDCGGGGAYCLDDEPTPRTLELRRAAARMLRMKGLTFVTHSTAAVVFGFPFVDRPAHVQLARHRAGAVPHLTGVLTSSIPDEHRARLAGVPMTSRARTLVDLARTAPDKYVAQGIVDAALRIGVELDEVEQVLAYCSGWPGIEQARAAVAFAEPLCESPLESRVRWWLHDAGLWLPTAQFRIGSRRADFCYEEQRLVIEADGKVKYSADAPWLTDEERAAWDPSAVLWKEKTREDGFRSAGFDVLRAYWSDGADGGAAFAERVRQALTAKAA